MRESPLGDFMKYAFKFNIGLHLDACVAFPFKLSVMIDTSKLYCLIPVLMILTFIQGQRVVRKLEHLQSFCCKVA